MTAIELEIEDDLWAWPPQTAAWERLSAEEGIGVLIGLGGNLRSHTTDGRNSQKAAMCRHHLIAPT